MTSRLALVGALVLVAVAVALALPPIPQDPAYHALADQRRVLGVPHFLNVVSNVAFVAAGVFGLRVALRAGVAVTHPWERLAILVLFSGVTLTGVGSAWYHLAPSNATLVWDRLPMTLAFMALLALTIGERISVPLARRLFPVLLAAGAGSVVFWYAGEVRGHGDLRPYGLVQFLPLAAIPLMALLFPPRYTGGSALGVALGLYAAAKLFEALDAAILSLGQIVSGHTLKHVVAAGATAVIARMIATRRPCGAETSPPPPLLR